MTQCVPRGLAAALLWLLATAASGHSASEATTPADGATLAAAPAEIRIRFDRPVRVTTLRLRDAEGGAYDVTFPRGEQTKTLVARPEALPDGRYTVEWRGLSADGHAASGTFSFRIE